MKQDIRMQGDRSDTLVGTLVQPRDPALVMRLSRLGSFAIDARGVGHAVLTAHAPARSYSLVAFAHDRPPEKRSDRVIADARDATFIGNRTSR